MEREEYKAALQRRMQAFKIQEQWERSHPISYEPSLALEIAAELYELFPPPPDSHEDEAEGIAQMRKAFSLLRRSST